MPFILFSIKHTEPEDGLKSTQLKMRQNNFFSKIDIFIHSTAFIYQFRLSANTALHNLSFNVFLSGFILNSFNGVFIIKTFDISSEIIIIKSRLNSSFEFQEMVGQNFFIFAKRFLKPIVKQYNTSLNLKSGKFKL